MNQQLGTAILILGLLTTVGAQIAMCLHAFTGNPLKGILCLFVPFYVYVYAKKHPVGVWGMRAWFAGIAMWVAGAMLAS